MTKFARFSINQSIEYGIVKENIIQEINDVVEVTVYGKKNAIMGNIVCANIRLSNNADKKLAMARIKRYCKKSCKRFKKRNSTRSIGKQV